MSDSLVLGHIEILSGGIPCGLPECPDAIFRLGQDWSLSAPQWTSEKVAGVLMDGEQITAFRASNRTPDIPVTILVPHTGDIQADRLQLAIARETLLQTCSREHWQITWTRDGGLPLVFNAQGVSATVVKYSLPMDWGLVSQVQIQCEAFPFGHSEDQEAILLTSPSPMWELPATPVTLDDYNTVQNWLVNLNTGVDNSTFEASLGGWLSAYRCVLTRTNAQAHSGTYAMQMQCNSAGDMSAVSTSTSLYEDGSMLQVRGGETVHVNAWFRSAVTARSVNVGADFYDSNGTVVGSTLRGANVTDSTSAWTQATATLTAPSGAAYCRANVQVVAAVLNEVHYVDDVWLDGGGVESYVQSSQWTQSSVAVTGTKSAWWTRSWHTAPVYDAPTKTVADISGRAKFEVYVGLTTPQSQWSTWHGGTVNFSVTLYDVNGNTISAKSYRTCKVSALSTQPYWQLVTIHLPQNPTGFDYTQVKRYVFTAWNKVDPGGKLVLQAGAFLNGCQAVATSTGTTLARGAWHTFPAPVGTARAPLGLEVAPGPSVSYSTIEWTTPGTHSWTAPVGVTSVTKAEAWAAGGGGAGSGGSEGNSDTGGGGGGGGEYAQEINMPVTAGNSYDAVVGAKGTLGTDHNPGTTGGDSYFTANAGLLLRAHGGECGRAHPGNLGGRGGKGSTNYLSYPGGDGNPTNCQGNPRGGGGGSSAGPYSAGNDGGIGAAYIPGAAVQSGGPGGEGGQYDHSLNNMGLSPTSGPGGGGGGGARNSNGADHYGADGKDGKIRLTYGAGGITPLVSLLVHMPDPDQPVALSPLCPVGNGADTPNGATEYTVPAVGSLAARFDGTYTVFLISSGTYGSSGSSRTVTVTIKQYPYSGGTAVTTSLSRTFTPSTDIVNGYIDMGQVTLPIAAIPPGNTTAAYFVVTVTSGQTADRFYDVLFLDTQGQTVLINTSGTGWNRVWLDPPEHEVGLGMVIGSDADRDRAYSLTNWVDRWPGGPFYVRPDTHNRMLLYAQQGCPGATLTYLPYFLVDRTK